MRKKNKRLLSIFLTLIMMFTIMAPTMSVANEDPGASEYSEESDYSGAGENTGEGGSGTESGSQPCEHDYSISGTTATCIEDGYTTYICSYCGDTYEEATGALGHDFILIDQQDATDENDGFERYECSRCEEIDEVIIPAAIQNVEEPKGVLFEKSAAGIQMLSIGTAVVIDVPNLAELQIALAYAAANPDLPVDIHIVNGKTVDAGSLNRIDIPANVYFYVDAGGELLINKMGTGIYNSGSLFIDGIFNHSNNVTNVGNGKAFLGTTAQIKGNTKFVTNGDPIDRQYYWVVTFDAKGGAFADGPRLTYEVPKSPATKVTEPPVPTKDGGFVFDGWLTANGGEWNFNNPVNSDLYLYANWSLQQFTVTFEDWDGTELNTQQVNYGAAAVAPAKPDSMPGYHFTGWDADFSNITGNLTVTAEYTINSYTVIFMADNKEIDKQSVKHGSDATAPADPTKTGYTFKGWDVPFSNITGDLTVTAEFVVNYYNVIFMADGSEFDKQSIAYGSAAKNPGVPTKTGYTFDKWDVPFGNITGDLTVTAEFKINYYNVIFMADGSEFDKQSIAYGSAATDPGVPTKTGYTFREWDAPFGNITGNLIVSAEFDINYYNVIFMADGSEFDKQSIAYGDAAKNPGVPTKTGHTFTGWDKAYDCIADNLTVTAEFDVNYYDVTFIVDGEVYGDVQRIAYSKGAVAPADPTKTGYTFDKWDVPFGNITGNLTVTAEFKINYYDVIFMADGSEFDKQSIAYGGAAKNPGVPEKTGYTFDKWDVPFGNITGNLTVTAEFKINYYDVIFMADGSEFDKQSIAYGGAADDPGVPEKTGYTFDKWDVPFGNITGNLTVTAEFKINYYDVIFMADGSEFDKQSIAYGSAAKNPGVPEKTGYTFTGWDVPFTNITENLDVNALFEINIYTVTFEDYDGTVLDTQDVEYGGVAAKPANPIRRGFTFVSWDTVVEQAKTAWDFANQIWENVTLTANWRANSRNRDEDSTNSRQSTGGGNANEEVSIIDDETPLAFLEDHIQYVNGYPDGSFGPDMGITRAEAAAIFHRLLANEDKDVPAVAAFNDMDANEWYYQAVAYLTDMGITTGYPDGSFRPEAPITRAEYATMASRFDNLVQTDENIFSDVNGEYWAASFINSAAAKGWVNGFDDGSFRPENPVTRAQVVTIVNNMLNRDIRLVNIPADAPSYTDLTTAHWAYCAIIEASSTHEFERLEDNTESWLQ